jgi:hypothetical protein
LGLCVCLFLGVSVGAEDGRAWVWGKMQAGVTRDGKVMNDQLQPRRLDLPTPSPAITVSCGQAHTCFGTGVDLPHAQVHC